MAALSRGALESGVQMSPVPQPAKAILAVRRITNRRVAAVYACSPHYVGRVLNGLQEPSPRFRAFLAAFLDLPEDALFRSDESAVANVG